MTTVPPPSEKESAQRKRTTHRCPHCGDEHLYVSQRRRPKDKLLMLVGLKPLRCEKCRRRYYRF